MPVSDGFLAQLFGLEGEVAFITGGGGAVGAATAKAFARAGASAVLADKGEEAAGRVAAEVRALGARALAVAMDVTREDSVQAAVEEATRAFGKVDILVNNAGVNIRKEAQNLTRDDWKTVMDVNVTGYFLCARAVGPGMMARRSGRIINVASILGFRGSGITPNLVYATSKGAVVNFTRTLAGEWAPHGIHVNCISPGVTRTPELFPAVIPVFLKTAPVGRVAEVEDIVRALLFLAADSTSFLLGHDLIVDGGYTVM